MGGIFISYRREDGEGYAGRLFDKLKEHFGKERVFMDVVAIDPGVDFVDALNNALGSCEVLISVIGKLWLSVTDAEGNRRLDDPLDYIRLETKIALDRDIRVIPVLVQDAPMPSEKELPDELKKLARRQALKLSSDRWDYDIGRLIEVLEKAVGTVPAKSPMPQSGEGIDSARAGISGPGPFVNTKLFIALTILLVIMASVVYYRQHKSSDNKPNQSTPIIVPPKTTSIPPKPLPVAGTENKPPIHIIVSPKSASIPPKSLPVARTPSQMHIPAPSIVPARNVPPVDIQPAKFSVKLSEDRGTIIIVGPAGQETDHISLDPDRVQKIFNAPDGKWSVAVIKVRNKPQYGAMPINLKNGSALETSEIPSMPNNVTFENMVVVMGFKNSETKRISLQN